METDGSEPRIWPYALLFVLLCAGAIWGRKVDVSQRESASNAAVAARIEFEEELAVVVASVETCRTAGRCDEIGAGFFGTSTAAADDDDLWMAGLIKQTWPEFGAYVDSTLQWNATVRTAVAEDLSVADPGALEGLLNDGEPERLERLLAGARVQLADREDHGRLMSRLFGWGWKLCLALMFVLPIAASHLEHRRHQRAQHAMWRRLQDRETPPVAPVGSERT